MAERKKKENGPQLDITNDWDGFYKSLNGQHPREVVLLSAAFLDAQLRVLLKSFMIDDEDAVDDLIGSEERLDRTISNFGARIETAYCLGLISKNMRKDLKIVSKIRNTLAHSPHNITFESERVKSLCRNLDFGRFPPTQNHFEQFKLAVSSLSSFTAFKIIETSEHRPIPKDIELAKSFASEV